MKRLILGGLGAAALICTASAATAQPAQSVGQSFYISTTLSDTAGRAADPTIYNIEGNTYFKLRDLGRLLDFGVSYDRAENAVHIAPDASYAPEAGESSTISNTATANAAAIPTEQTLYLNGTRISPTMYNIKGNNYVGLRALGKLVDFGVAFNYDNKRITAYAAYPYIDETAWNAAYNDFTNDLRTLGESYYNVTAAHFAPVLTDSTDWRAAISALRSVKNAPPVQDASGALYRAGLYWADRLAAALTNTAFAAPPKYDVTLTRLADSALFDNPDKSALQRDFAALSGAYLGVDKLSLPTVSNGYSKDALARFTLADSYAAARGATAADEAAARAYFAGALGTLSALQTDDARLAEVYRLLQSEFRSGSGGRFWTTAYGKNGSMDSFSFAAAADFLFAEAGIPSFTARSYTGAWNIIYTNTSWAVFDFSKGGTLHSLDEYMLNDTHPGSTILLTQVMRPGASYYKVSKATPDKYFTYTPVAGRSVATAAQLQAYIKAVNPDVAQSVLDMAPLYLSEGEAEGIRGDIAFAQSCLETGNFKFTGSAVTLAQNNFCGMGVTSNGMTGASFETPQLGIRAQIQHLKAYANTQSLKNECVDPRFSLVTRGAAPTVQYLGIQENPSRAGWSAGADYGVKILNILEHILTYPAA